MEHISFTDYDRITDQVIWLSPTLSLNFTVTLSSKDKAGNRRSFVFENEYQSKYFGVDKARSIKRNMNFYYVIDDRNDFGNGVIFRTHDVYYFSQLLENRVIPWFFGDTRIYEEKERKLVISGNFEHVIYQPDEYKYIKIDPIVFTLDNNSFKEGVRLEINRPDNIVDLIIDKFFDIYYIFKNTDMYGVACSMLNFVKTAPYGVNIFKPTGLGGGYNPNDGWTDDKNDKIDDNIQGGTRTSTRNSFLDSIGGTGK